MLPLTPQNRTFTVCFAPEQVTSTTRCRTRTSQFSPSCRPESVFGRAGAAFGVGIPLAKFRWPRQFAVGTGGVVFDIVRIG